RAARGGRNAPPGAAGGARLAAARVGDAAGAGRARLATAGPHSRVESGTMAAAEKIQDLVHRLSEDSSTLVRSEIELAKAEVREKLQALARAGAFGAVAAVIALLGAFALVQFFIYALGGVLPYWASSLIVAVAMLAVAGLLGLLALRSAKRGAPPVPEQAVAEAKA